MRRLDYGGEGHPADAEEWDKSLSECKIARQNKSCYVAIEDTSTPVPASIRVNSAPGSKVEVRIKRKPFDQLSFDVSTQLQPTPDVAAAVLKQLLDPLKSLVFESHNVGPGVHHCAGGFRHREGTES